uniref:Uncharacterized protein n=1 Tax=Chromera velia CCMP2878 TaxID=1169474 RepID=A0A0G4FQW9_9ALVE|eukprot:Cvel_18285.t1-p1 / transcript=Cvel_18285.t1 / gene=Cvel_18285 / organism=Chromera_velia_CCMP2878 / gene_product=hypothetical protein / transcript_product=hypothetical protein / location=Cvel_scaffold1507:3226-4696(-) / protein_length=210 / sequence_SO=supercontig / SO=protein_coding / is_pseudo=false
MAVYYMDQGSDNRYASRRRPSALGPRRGEPGVRWKGGSKEGVQNDIEPALDGKRGRRVAADLLRDRVGYTAAAASSSTSAGTFSADREGQGGVDVGEGKGREGKGTEKGRKGGKGEEGVKRRDKKEGKGREKAGETGGEGGCFGVGEQIESMLAESMRRGCRCFRGPLGSLGIASPAHSTGVDGSLGGASRLYASICVEPDSVPPNVSLQ